MFKWLFIYWFNNTDTPSNLFKVNLWSYINLRLFKFKISNYIAYYILSLNNLELKKLNIFYKNNYFDYIYIKSIFCFLFIIIATVFFLLF